MVGRDRVGLASLGWDSRIQWFASAMEGKKKNWKPYSVLDVRQMVDRVYKKQIPAQRKALEKLREDFSKLSSKTNWAKLRIEPLLKHVEALEQLLGSGEFSREFSRLTKGVVFFHSDLEYLRKNVKGLEQLLQSEKEFLGRRNKNKRS